MSPYKEDFIPVTKGFLFTYRRKDEKDIMENRQAGHRKNPHEYWRFSCLLQKGFPTQHTFYYQSGEGKNVVIYINKETFLESLPPANTWLRVFIDYYIFLI